MNRETQNLVTCYDLRRQSYRELASDAAFLSAYAEIRISMGMIKSEGTAMKIQKRDGRVVPYEEDKIREAIHKANNEVEERYRASEGLIEEILEDVQQEGKQTQTVEHIQDMIEEHLVEHNKYTLAKKYIVYRYQRSLLRKSNTTDESILKLIRNENKELAEENSNKNTRLASTQRD